MIAMPERPTLRLAVDPRRPDPAVIAEAARLLRAGRLVAFPTETVYGLGAHALDADAVGRIFAAKQRPHTDPLIVHLASAADLRRVAAMIPADAARLAEAFWPGPLTIIVPKHRDVPDVVTATLPSVAVRVPSHPVAQALLAAVRVPVAAPSANRFSRPSPTSAAHVLTDLDGRIDAVLDGGATEIGVESTIVDCTVSPAVVRRAGGVPVESLLRVVADIAVADQVADVAAPQLAPGQLLRHYAPAARLTVYDGPFAATVARLAREARQQAAGGARVGVLAPEEALTALAPELAASASAGRVVVASLGPRDDGAAAARALFASLRDLDAAGVDVILALGPTRAGLGTAVWDRLRRAAEGRVLAV